jgi:2-hydroxycyclohexanecarboxyl-CoA dehydrogenase
MQQAGFFMSSLDGRVAFVTGAASGIGRAIALELARWGARVAVADLDAAGAVETVAQLAEASPDLGWSGPPPAPDAGGEDRPPPPLNPGGSPPPAPDAGGSLVASRQPPGPGESPPPRPPNFGRSLAPARAEGGRGLAVPLDVTDYAAVQRAFGFVRDQLGPVDVLVNAAGWDTPERFVDSAPATWERLLAINLGGAIHTIHAALPSMQARRYGRIVSLGSDAGRVGSSGEAVYSAAKGGVIAFTKTIARETARQGITVNCVCPGPTDTPLLARFTEANPRLVEALQRAIPMGRLGQPADVAPAVAFLVSDGAAFITGQTLSVSGGLTMS